MKKNSDAYIIEVDIKPYEKDLQKKLKKQIESTEIFTNEYIHKYLSKINAFPTIENIKLVQKHMNIDQALILPDIIREKIVILPNMKNKIKDTEVNELELFREGPKEKQNKLENIKLLNNSRISSLSSSCSKYNTTTSTSSTTLISTNTTTKKKTKESLSHRKLLPLWKIAKTSSTPTNSTVSSSRNNSSKNNKNSKYDLIEPLDDIINSDKISIAEIFKEFLCPPIITEDSLNLALQLFIESLHDILPIIKLNNNYVLFDTIRKLMKTSESKQLFKLLIHYVYWNLLHPMVVYTINELKYRYNQRRSRSSRSKTMNTSHSSSNSYSGASCNNFSSNNNEDNDNSYSFSGYKNGNDNNHDNDNDHNDGSIFSHVDLSLQLLKRKQMLTNNNIVFNKKDNCDTNNDNSHHEKIYVKEDIKSFKSIISSNPSITSDTLINNKNKNNSHINNTSTMETMRLKFFNTLSYSNKDCDKHDDDDGADDDSNNDDDDDYIITDISIPLQNPSEMTYGLLRHDTTENLIDSFDLTFINTIDTVESLSAFEKEQLLMQLERCTVMLFNNMGKNENDVVAGRQALISACHFIVDNILTTTYIWFASLSNDGNDGSDDHKFSLKLHHRDNHHPNDCHKSTKHYKIMKNDIIYDDSDDDDDDDDNIKMDEDNGNKNLKECITELNLRLRRLVHNGLSDIIDPARIYTSALLMNALKGPEQVHSIARHGCEKFYAVSVATKALLGGTKSSETRKFLEMSESNYSQKFKEHTVGDSYKIEINVDDKQDHHNHHDVTKNTYSSNKQVSKSNESIHNQNHNNINNNIKSMNVSPKKCEKIQKINHYPIHEVKLKSEQKYGSSGNLSSISTSRSSVYFNSSSSNIETVYSNNIQKQTLTTKLNHKNMISLYNENKIKRNNKNKKTITIDNYFNYCNINDDKNTSNHHNTRRSVRSSSSSSSIKSIGSLDFGNLFVDQPHNNYFPSINVIATTNKIDNISSPYLSSSKHSSSSISFDMKPSEVRDINKLLVR